VNFEESGQPSFGDAPQGTIRPVFIRVDSRFDCNVPA
jgi:hypothetical protein